MNVAWATHRSQDPLAYGGAEFADRMMLERRPEYMRVTMVPPGFSSDPETRMVVEAAERVIVSGMHFTQDELMILAARHPVVWVHDCETIGHPLYDFASDLIFLTPRHMEWERAYLKSSSTWWQGPREHLNPGWFDTDPFFNGAFVPPEQRGWSALWAHRGAPEKNLPGAIEWAEQTGHHLRVMMKRPREEVIEAMKRVRTFVLLSLVQDPGPWSVIEAQLAGCLLEVNDSVGVTEATDRFELRSIIDSADKAFWRIVEDY